MSNIIPKNMDVSSDAAVVYARCYVNGMTNVDHMEDEKYTDPNVIAAVRETYGLCEDMREEMIQRLYNLMIEEEVKNDKLKNALNGLTVRVRQDVAMQEQLEKDHLEEQVKSQREEKERERARLEAEQREEEERLKRIRLEKMNNMENDIGRYFKTPEENRLARKRIVRKF